MSTFAFPREFFNLREWGDEPFEETLECSFNTSIKSKSGESGKYLRAVFINE